MGPGVPFYPSQRCYYHHFSFHSYHTALLINVLNVWKECVTSKTEGYNLGWVVQSGVKRAKFEISYESLKGKFSLLLFVNNLMTGRSKRNRDNYL